MAKRKPRDETLWGIHCDLDEEKYKLERAGSLLRILAEHVQEGRHADPDEAWFEAEYLGNRIAEHVEALAKVSDRIDRFSIDMKHGVGSAQRVPILRTVPTDGDAA